MKTGTGAEWRKGYHANYVGVAPWPNPVVAFSVRITHEPTSSRVNRTAREVLTALLDGLHKRSGRRIRHGSASTLTPPATVSTPAAAGS
jgi:cell division protein FtsI/penicillin-binding protein 2